ncbi:MAG: hypothetical protein KC416_12985 [Myxococcales bacterium]|nr:hypothetical protein [Myxococcales bacterium]
MTTRFSLLFNGLLFLVAAGCSSEPGVAPFEKPDAAFRDGGSPPTDGGRDATTDGGEGPLATESDFCGGAAGTVIYCDPTTPCSADRACVPGACSTDANPAMPIAYHCVPRGTACASVDDCCVNPPCSQVSCSTQGICLSLTDGCQDWRTCPRGFACEENTCVDRRTACISSSQCPTGFTCRREPEAAGSTCRFVANQECSDDGDCELPALFRCSTEGPSKGSCVYQNGNLPFLRSPCEDDTDCRVHPPLKCETLPSGSKRCIDPQGSGVLCQSDDDCQPGQETCTDTNGYGVKRCQPTGTCNVDSDCPDAQLCFDILGIGAAQCG